MDTEQRVSEADLIREPRRVIEAVRRGEAALIERNGEPEAALIDITDYRIQRAALRYYAAPPEIADPEMGLSDEAVASVADPQARYDLVLAYYLASALSLSRAAQLLSTSYVELRLRLARLGVALRLAPRTIEEAQADAAVAEAVASARRA